MDLATIAAELYGMPPKDFIAARDARASEARQAGDKVLATSLKQLRKPSVGAWMANVLVRQQPRDIDRLIELGATLRSTRSLEGAQIRSATKRKQETVTKLARQALAIADRDAQPVSQAAELELEATLDAAFSDAQSAQYLLEGDLTNGLHYSGLGFAPSTRSDAPRPATRAPSRAGGAAVTSTQVTKAKRDAVQARRDAQRADASVEKAQQAVTTTEADLKRLRVALTVALRQASKARDQAATAEKRLEQLRRGRART